MKTYLTQSYGVIVEQNGPEVLINREGFSCWVSLSCLVHGLDGVWCSFQGDWYVRINSAGKG